jgi:hypothetical protein
LTLRTAAAESGKESIPAGESSPDASAPYPTSFAQVVELINSGKPIPDIKNIPDTILEGERSESTINVRKKPWEKENSPAVLENISR